MADDDSFSNLKAVMSGNKKKPKSRVQYVPHNTLDVSPTQPVNTQLPGPEGYDSEGKKKKDINRD